MSLVCGGQAVHAANRRRVCFVEATWANGFMNYKGDDKLVRQGNRVGVVAPCVCLG